MKKEKFQLILQKYKKPFREYYEQLYANKSENPEQKDNFPQIYSPPELDQEEVQNLPANKIQGQMTS